MDFLLVVAVALLLAGVVGSVVPMVPGAGLSLVGIYLYWWSTGYATPGPLALVAFTLVGVGAMVADHFAGAFAAKAGGASTKTTVLAAVAGLPLAVVAGPAGLVVGITVVVFLAEFYRTREPTRSVRAGLFATAGVLGSAAVQLLVTVSLVVGFALVAI
ncbi:DUF456 domain-containing protein [Halorussus marinus]|uniref:DUF456 domain-containing protein n=1 Tax=Halorussus marinus TaxID=2505976 RepID=UPI00106E37C5|nr:DUF456 domain-containing protein [Halorussus marinus]